jgi:mono/diheme cytochrome c family protein
MKYIATLIILAAACLAGSASDCRRPTSFYTPLHAPSYYTPLVATYQTVTYPTYAVGYSPDLTETVNKLIDHNKWLVEKVLERERSDSPKLKAASSPGLAVLTTNCATCHDASLAKVKGGGNAFFRSGEVVDEGDNVDRMVEAIGSGKMGSRSLPTLTPEQRLAGMHFLVKLPTPAAKVTAKPMDPAR